MTHVSPRPWRVVIFIGIFFGSLLGRVFAQEETQLVSQVLLNEIAYERYQLMANRHSSSTLPVPNLEQVHSEDFEEPIIDGSLEDDLWDEASAFEWNPLGTSSLALKVDWKFKAFISQEHFYLSGEYPTAERRPHSFYIHLSAQQQIRLFLDPSNPGKADWVHPDGVTPLSEPLGIFRSTLDEGRWVWELKLSRTHARLQEPLGPLSPVSFSLRTAKPLQVLVSPQYRLLPSLYALRIKGVDIKGIRESTLTFDIENYYQRKLNVRTSLKDEVDLEPGAIQEFQLKDGVYRDLNGQGWEFEGGPLALRLGYPSFITEAKYWFESSEKNLGLIRSRLESSSESTVANFEDRLEVLKKRLEASSERDIENLEKIYLQIRELKRRTLFSLLPSRVDPVVFLRRHHFRKGEFYRSYLNQLPGGDVVQISLRNPNGGPQVLFTPHAGGSVRDLALSGTGEKIAFSHVREGDRIHLEEVELKTQSQKTLTSGDHKDIEPTYLNDGRIIFTSNRVKTISPIDETENFVLYIKDPKSDAPPQRLSFNNLMDFTPTVLDDGRILFLRWVLEDKPGHFINALWTIYPDGRGLNGFFGMNRPGVTIEPHQIPDSRKIICVDAGPNGHWRSPLVGDLAIIEFNQSENRIVQRIRAERGGFKTPHALSKNLFLTSYGWTDSGWAIYLMDSKGDRELVYRDLEYSCFNPLAVRAREKNNLPHLASKDLDRPSRLIIQDVYQGLPGVKKGEVKTLRVVASPDIPSWPTTGSFQDRRFPWSQGQRTPHLELGTVEVSEDGSVFVEVPSRTNLFFQLLDERGDLVQTMRDSLHFAPGEGRSCIGCHESRSLAPVGYPSQNLVALGKPLAKLKQDSKPRAISFPRDIQPILDRHCVTCHSAENPQGGIALSSDQTPYFSLAYESLVKRPAGNLFQIDSKSKNKKQDQLSLAGGINNSPEALLPRSTGSAVSPLLKLIDKGHQKVQLSTSDRKQLARWIDLNVPYYSSTEQLPKKGSRKSLTAHSRTVLQAVFRAKCRGCHLPPDPDFSATINLSRPELSLWLRASLPTEEGGLARCSKSVFSNKDDRHYRAILKALKNP